MRIRPGGLELLRAARVVIDAAIVPQVADAQRGALRTIERAMTLAEDRLTRNVAASAADLGALEDARATMRGPVLEALPPERRYDARLVAKAISVATGELANGHVPERREYERLVELLGAPAAINVTPAEIACALPSLNERLSERIRLGEADVGTSTHAATLAHLEAITDEALSESNPTYRRRVSDRAAAEAGVPSGALPMSPLAASLAAWSDVPRTFVRAFPIDAPRASVRQGIDAWLHVRSAFGEAVCASGNVALATQADLLGCFTQRLAANPRVPMVAVEGAHLAHDLSVAIAEASSALFKLAFFPFRLAEPRLSEVARLP